jgi:short-subunit dehydrogenase
VRVEAIELELMLPDAPGSLSRTMRARGLSVDMLVNNAGVGFNSRFEEITLE